MGGGKPKMRHYFSLNGWPTSGVLGAVPSSEEAQARLIDALQDWKTEKYKDIIGSGQVAARPGVVRLMGEAQAAGVPVAVCSAATKSAVEFVLGSLLGQERFQGLDLFMAGDDVKEKKPDPTIYKVRAAPLEGCARVRAGWGAGQVACAWGWQTSCLASGRHARESALKAALLAMLPSLAAGGGAAPRRGPRSLPGD